MDTPPELIEAAQANGHTLAETWDYAGLICSCERCHCGQEIRSAHPPIGWLHLPCTGMPHSEWSDEMRRAQIALLDTAQEERNRAAVLAHPESFDAATRWRYGAEEGT